MSIQEKHEHLKNIFLEMKSVVIGFSGGVDSTLVLKVAADTIGEKALAVIARSSTYPEREYEEAIELVRQIGARSRIITTEEDKNPKFISNTIDRCYFCKTELFSKLQKIANEEGMNFVVDGSNVDDEGDFRPGMKALDELSVRSPLREAGFSKSDVRELSKILGLPTHDKPSFACLSSRFPYGDSITAEKLKMVGAAEDFLRESGFRAVRVRHYDVTARIELGLDELGRIMEETVRQAVVAKLKEIGYTYVTIDLEGFRSGSMNAVLVNTDTGHNPAEKTG